MELNPISPNLINEPLGAQLERASRYCSATQTRGGFSLKNQRPFAINAPAWAATRIPTEINGSLLLCDRGKFRGLPTSARYFGVQTGVKSGCRERPKKRVDNPAAEIDRGALSNGL